MFRLTSRIVVVVTTVAILATMLSDPALAREWTDSTGKFRVEANLVKFTSESIWLEKTATGGTIEVPVNKLSQKDRQFVQELLGEQTVEEFRQSADTAQRNVAPATTTEQAQAAIDEEVQKITQRFQKKPITFRYRISDIQGIQGKSGEYQISLDDCPVVCTMKLSPTAAKRVTPGQTLVASGLAAIAEASTIREQPLATVSVVWKKPPVPGFFTGGIGSTLGLYMTDQTLRIDPTIMPDKRRHESEGMFSGGFQGEMNEGYGPPEDSPVGFTNPGQMEAPRGYRGR